MSFWVDLAEALLPGKQDGEAKSIYRWRQTVALSILANSIAIVMTNVLIWGFATPLYPGVAAKNEVGTVQAQISEIRADQITRNLKEARTTECVAQQQGNMAALTLAQSDLQKAYNEFFNLMKVPPRIPTCDELVLTAAPVTR